MFRIKSLFTVPALLNILGIGIAIAAFQVLMALADFEFSFNKSINRHEDIYQMTYHSNGSHSNSIMRPLAEAVGENLAYVENIGCLTPWDLWTIYAKRSGSYYPIECRTALCSNGLLDVFGFKIIEGDISRFHDFGQMIISQKFAAQTGLKVGDIIKPDLQQQDETEIVAIYEDFANNSEFVTFKGFRCLGDRHLTNAENWNYTYYFRFTEGAPEPDLTGLKTVMRDLVHSFYKDVSGVSSEQIDNELNNFIFEFVPLDDLHLHSEISGGFHLHSDKSVAYTLLILAILVILIAFINYFNFFMARVPQRLKAVNTRKVFGCSRAKLVAGLVGESVMFTVVAMVLAIVLQFTVITSLISDSVNMETNVLPNYKVLIITILSAIAMAVLTSLYPAFYITKIPPALALKGQLTQSHDSKLRYLLIGFQVTASVALIICSLFIHKNNDYLLSRDIGFNRENLLSVYTTKKIAENRETVRSQLLQNSCIKDIAWTGGNLIGVQRMSWGRQNPANSQETLYFDVTPVSYNFLDFMGITFTEGRGFKTSDELSKNGVIVFNETARKRFGFTLDSQIDGHNDTICELAGFCNDFNFKPLQYGITPFAFYVYGKEPWQLLQHLYIRTAENVDRQKAINYIQEVLSDIDPDYEIMNPEIITFEKEVATCYSAENSILTMVTIFTGIAIIISVMGIFGIVLFDTERRRKEIGVRKVNGATVAEILAMFNRKFLILTAICSAVAVPIAFIVVSAYFSGFTYHYEINVWPFVFGVLMALIVTALVVSGASLKAANENPVKTLKTE